MHTGGVVVVVVIVVIIENNRANGRANASLTVMPC
jgi:hypothetical protein